MKKLSTIVTAKNGTKRAISVWLEEETAKALEVNGDKKLVHQYIVEEYKSSLLERKETRRHQSLNKSLDGGFDFVDESVDIECEAIEYDEIERLHDAIKQLKPKQQWLIEQVFFLGRQQKDIAKELGVDKTTVRDLLKTIYKKIEKLL